MELYDGAELIKTYDNSAEINDSISLAPGIHYLSSKAYNNKNESTQSPTSIVYVNLPLISEPLNIRKLESLLLTERAALQWILMEPIQ